MKFIHIADVHLGAEPLCGRYTDIRKKEIWDSFENIIKVCNKEEADVLFIAGDLFHRQPLLRELKEVDYLFSTLEKTKVFLIAGNHDYIKKDSYYRTFKLSDNVYTLFGEQVEYIVDNELSLAVYGASYYKKEIKEEIYNINAGNHAQYEVLLAHGGDAKHIPVNFNRLSVAGFDYVALGHIHLPGAPVKNKIIYSGALEPVDVNDVGPHGYVTGTIDDTGVHTKFVPSAKRKYIHLEIEINQDMTFGEIKDTVKTSIEERGTENLYKIKLTGLRNPETEIDTYYMDSYENIVDIEDRTCIAFDYEKIYYKNKDNIIGKYIESFNGAEPGTVEYMAMEEGVKALLNDQRK